MFVMGSRSSFETLAGVIQAFTVQTTWRQAELAARIEIQPRALRKVLTELQHSKMPLSREEEHPHVYWSVPPGWFPGGLVFEQKDWFVLFDAVARVPDSARRRSLVERLVAGHRGSADGLERLSTAITVTSLSAEQHSHFLVLQEAIFRRTAAEMKYYSFSSGLDWRFVTPVRLLEHPKPRFLAYCHTRKELRWFRLGNIQRIQVAPHEPYVEVSNEAVDAVLAKSVDGFHDGSSEEYAFIVRKPEANWVKANLLPGMRIDPHAASNELRVVAQGGVLIVARFVAGLGGAARAEGKLREVVCQLCRDTLEVNAH